MKKTNSIITVIGMLFFLAYSITDRFITPLTDWVAIPWMIIAIALIITGILKPRMRGRRK